MTTWTYPSSSGPGEYTVKLHDTGKLECDCRGFRIKREGKPRQCRHVEDVIKKNSLTTVIQDVYHVVTGQAEQLVLPVEQVDYKDHYEKTHDLGYVEPMLASALTKRQKNEPWEESIRPYQDGNWVSEIKYDGYRVVFAKSGNNVMSWSRPRPGQGSVGLAKPLPAHIVEAIKQLMPDGTFDGEVYAGLTGKSYTASRLDMDADKRVAVFDVLKIGGQDVMGLTYQERRGLLSIAMQNVLDLGLTCLELAGSNPPSAQHVQGLWDAGAEGVILKRLDSIYRPGWRSPHWVKIKLEFYTVGTVVGWEAAKNGPYSKVKLISDEGVETTVKTKDNYWLREFAANPEKYVGARLVFKHYGPTPDGKYRGPIIWDHWAGEGE